MKRNFYFSVLAVLAVVIATALAETRASMLVKPKDGFVPTKEVAIKIAVAIWEPIYGAEDVTAEKPYEARLRDGTWIVKGSLPKGANAGVLEARISKENGRILGVSHDAR